MIPDNPKGIIELDNRNIRCVIFQVDNNNNSEILSTSVSESQGIHNGVIVNITKASDTIRSCISDAEKKAKVLLKKINIVLEQPEFLCTKFSKHKKINGSKIHKDDIEFLLKEAKKQVTRNDEKQTIIHIFNHNYVVDGKTFIEEPIDVYADHLSHEMTFVTMPKNNIKNITQTFVKCDIEIERFISSTFSLAVQLLNNQDLQQGSALMNIGLEKTSLGLFKNLALIHSITFPVGTDHIIKDISKVCSLSLEESKIIVDKIDFSFQKNAELFDENDHLKEFFFNGSKYRKISGDLLLNVVKARLDEIFGIIKKQIVVTGLSPHNGTNFFITGEGVKLYNFDDHCANFFKTSIKKTVKKHTKEKELESEENFLSCLGALKIIKDGWETEAIPEKVQKKSERLGFFARFFENS